MCVWGGGCQPAKGCHWGYPISCLYPQSPLPTVPGLPFPFALQLLSSFSTPNSIRARTPISGIALPKASQREALLWPLPYLTQPLSTPRAHPEDSGAVVAKRLKQEVGAGAGGACAGVHTCECGCDGTTCLGLLCQLGVTAVGVLGWVAQGTCSPVRSWQAGEQSRPELLALPVGLEPPGAAYRASLEEDTGSLSGESLDGHLQGE